MRKKCPNLSMVLKLIPESKCLGANDNTKERELEKKLNAV
jgi:hypothetical protein